MKNIPTIGSGETIICEYDATSNRINVLQLSKSKKETWLMDSICCTTKDSMCYDIEKILTEMMNHGFEQGRQHIRKAIGL